MDFKLSSEQDMLRNGLSKFLAGRYDLDRSRAAAKTGAGWQPEIWRAFADELGILGAPLPESAGGSGGGPVEAIKQAPSFFDAEGITVEQFFATSDDGTQVPYPHIFIDRSMPGCIAVAPTGQRFVNEGGSYQTFVATMHQRGFARVTRADGSIVHAGASLSGGEAVSIKFGDAVTRQAVIEGAPTASSPPKAAKPKTKTEASNQGDLF